MLVIGGPPLLVGESQHMLGGMGVVTLWLMLASLAGGLAVLSFRTGYVWHGLERPED